MKLAEPTSVDQLKRSIRALAGEFEGYTTSELLQIMIFLELGALNRELRSFRAAWEDLEWEDDDDSDSK